MNGKATEIEGFGDSVDAFKNLLTEFTKHFQTEPEIGVRLIRPKQCAVPRFLSGLAHSSGNPPDLTLVKYELIDRDPMSGEVQMLPSKQTYLILVDHDGVAHNLDRILKREGDLAKFNIALGLGTAKEERPGRRAAGPSRPCHVTAAGSHAGNRTHPGGRPPAAHPGRDQFQADGWRGNGALLPDQGIKHRAEKWTPVFGESDAKTKN